MKVLKILDEKLELAISVVLMSLMTIIIFIQVIMRYVMKNSLSWSEELARYLFIWLIYIGISYGAKKMQHIKIEASLKLFPKKVRPIIVIIGDFLFFGFSLFIVYTSSIVVQRQIELGQVSPAMHIPIWIVYAAPLVGFVLTSIRQAQVIIYRVKKLTKGGDING